MFLVNIQNCTSRVPEYQCILNAAFFLQCYFKWVPVHFKEAFFFFTVLFQLQHGAEYCDAERHLICISRLQESPISSQLVNTNLLKGFILIVPKWCCCAAQLEAAEPAAKHTSVPPLPCTHRFPQDELGVTSCFPKFNTRHTEERQPGGTELQQAISEYQQLCLRTEATAIPTTTPSILHAIKLAGNQLKWNSLRYMMRISHKTLIKDVLKN